MKQGLAAIFIAIWPVASNADVELSAYICNLDSLELFVIGETDEGTVLVGKPDAHILEGTLETTFVSPGRVIQIGDGAAAQLRFGRATEGACADASEYISDLVTWLGEQSGTISLPVFDFETTEVLDEANSRSSAAQLAKLAAEAERDAAQATMEAQQQTIARLEARLASLLVRTQDIDGGLQEADQAIRRALTDAIRRSEISEAFSASLISQLQSSGGMGDPAFPDLVNGVLEVIVADKSEACAVGHGSLDINTFDLENATAAIEGSRLDPQLKQQLLTAMTAAQHSPILLLQVLDRVCKGLGG